MADPTVREAALLPCPFCASEDSIVRYRYRDRGWWVECGYCLARGPLWGTEREAREDWNHRTALAAAVKEITNG